MVGTSPSVLETSSPVPSETLQGQPTQSSAPTPSPSPTEGPSLQSQQTPSPQPPAGSDNSAGSTADNNGNTFSKDGVAEFGEGYRGRKVDVDCSVANCIALTFDDGPSIYTPKLLDTLKNLGVPVTFFVVGARVVQFPNTLKRAVSEGHAVGNHSWNHPMLTKINDQEVLNEITSTDSAIRNVLGKPTRMFRPPYGARNAHIDQIIGGQGKALVLWSVDSLDWKTKNVEKNIANVTRDAKRGDIILMHDIYKTSVDAVPQIISQLRNKGFVFVTVPQLAGNINDLYGHRVFSQANKK